MVPNLADPLGEDETFPYATNTLSIDPSTHRLDVPTDGQGYTYDQTRLWS